MKKLFLLASVLALSGIVAYAQKVDYSIVSVKEESGNNFRKITSANDQVCMPAIKRSRKGIAWMTSRILDVSKDGVSIAYLSSKNNITNVFVKNLGRQGASVQRTNRSSIIDFSYSPDGKLIVFSEKNARGTSIFQTDATNGSICRQITNGAEDYSPVYSSKMDKIFFARQERGGSSIWSYDVKDNFLTSYSDGRNPAMYGGNAVLCTRVNNGLSEIWRVDYTSGVEECLVSSTEHSYSTPSVSPDGRWILFTGSSLITVGKSKFYNTDIYVCRYDGTQLTRLTYHAADDLSPVWSKDGKRIYFISQRGSAEGVANIWEMTFVLE